MFDTLTDSLKQIRRTPYQALAAVMVIFLTFFASSVFVFLSYGAVKVLEYFESAPQVIAFFSKGKDLPDEQISQIQSKLQETGHLASFKYVSTKEAEAIYKERNKENPLLLELVDYKILPPSIEISANKIEDLASLKDILAGQDGVTDVVFFEDIVNNLTNWINNIRYLGMAVLSFLGLQSVLIIFIIINMKIVSRKNELDVLRLIGASRGFIRRPFLMEGVIYGLLGGLLAFIAAYSLVLYATPALIYWLQDISIIPLPLDFLLKFLAGQILGGVLIGLIGSFIAAGRFIRN